MKVKTIALFANRRKPHAIEAGKKLSAFADSIGLRQSDSDPDVAVVLGGDGTVLAAAREFPGVPLLGLNAGSLGYLTAVEEPDFENALLALRNGKFSIRNREALQASADGAVFPRALNDVVFTRGVSGRAASFELSISGNRVADFTADGLIVATPTGSTAYSLAAGGSIILPEAKAIAVTPVCAHSIASRPLIVPDNAIIRIRIKDRSARRMSVSADGLPPVGVPAGKTVEVVRSNEPVKFVVLDGYDPYAVLERKLGWRGSIRNA